MAAFLGALASLGSLNIPYKIEAVQSECRPRPSPPAAQLPHGVCAVPSGVRGALFWKFLPGASSLPA